MIKLYKNTFIILTLLIAFFCGACEQAEEEQPPPESYAAEGTKLETGSEIDEESHEIIGVEIEFRPNEDFYFSYFNDEPFDEKKVRVKLVDTDTDETLAEEEYGDELEPESNVVYDRIWFGSPGRYKIVVEVDDEERAFQELIIEEEQE